MPIIAKESSGDFTPAPEGLHQAVCVDVVDLGMQDNPFQPGQKRRRGRIVWQIDELMDSGERFTASRVFTISLNEQGALRPFLEAWRGKRFTPEELRGFDLERLIGANCQLQIIHEPRREGGVFANVSNALPLPKGVEKLVPAGYVRVADRTTEPEAPTEHEEAEF